MGTALDADVVKGLCHAADPEIRIGRNHLPIVYGTRVSSLVYGVFSASAYIVVIAGAQAGYFPPLSLVAVLPAALSLFSFAGAFRYGEKIGQHPACLGANVAATLLTPALLGTAIILG